MNVIYWTWCLPQTLLGFILKLLFKAKKNYYYIDGKQLIVYESIKIKGGSISLGKYVILCENHFQEKNVVKHEHGHQLQSLILGWLYLLVIGLPSIIWCRFIYNKTKKDYYWFYTEKWANKLGKVEENGKKDKNS